MNQQISTKICGIKVPRKTNCSHNIYKLEIFKFEKFQKSASFMHFEDYIFEKARPSNLCQYIKCHCIFLELKESWDPQKF